MSWSIYMVVVIVLTINVTKGVSQGCGGTLNSNNPSEITSPDVDGDGKYENNVYCSWTISAAVNQVVRFRITSLDLENNTACHFDYIKVYDGSSVSAPLMGTYCGNTLPPTIIGTSNTMYVIFRTDVSITASGFRASYEQTYGCGSTLSSTQGVLTSPDFDGDGKYENYLDCRWTIVPAIQAINQVVRFRIISLDLENNTACNYDYIKVYDGKNVGAPLIDTYCGNTLPAPIFTTSHFLYVAFHTDRSVMATGFTATYEQIYKCGGYFTADHATILSPGYPNSYNNYLNCIYTIVVDPTKFIELTFDPTIFEIEGPSCTFDSLSVYDGNDASGSPLGIFCGTTVPQPISVLGTMVLRFITDRSITKRGFKISYSTQDTYRGCGGYLNNTQGEITSFDADGDGEYENFVDCRWTIVAADDEVGRLTIIDIDLENSTGCTRDYIKVYDGIDYRAPLIGQYCGDTLPPPIVATSKFLYVIFHTDGTRTRTGFNATYGRMNAPVSTVTITNKNSYIFTDGQDTNVTCKTGVCYPPAIITWSIISGINLGNGTTINNTDGTTTSILQYTADKSDDKNTLLCTATNGYGSPKTDTVMLDILYLDEVSISLDNNKLEGSEAHPVSISCSSNSNPVALITWYNGTTKLSSAQSNNDTFTIQQATCLDTGDYICNVKNRAIPQLEYNRTIELRIICSPRRDTRCSSTPIVSGNITDIVQLVADVISYPPPTFTWYHSKISTGDVEPIYNDDVYEQIDTNSSINTYKSTLHINITSNIFYTSYTVNVSNDVGYMELEYQVKPQLESAIPQTSEASHILLMVESGVGVLVFIIIIISVVVTLVRKLKQPKTSEEEPSPYDNLNMDTIKTNDTDSTYNEVGSSSDSTGITGHHTTHPQTNQNYDFEDSATYENPNMGEYYQDVGNVRTPVDGHEDDSKHTYVNTKKGDNPAYATVDKRKWNGV